MKNRTPSPLARVTLVALALSVIGVTLTQSASAAPRPCRFGFKGLYVEWSKTGTFTGRGEFSPLTGQAAVLPNFDWEITGEPRSVRIETDEPFSGGNSMKGFYGQADDANNLNVRIEANDTAKGKPIPHNVIVKLTFDAGTPASGWAFAVTDIDVDQVRMRAKDTAGNSISEKTIATWFQQLFDGAPSVDGVNIPKWDAADAAVVGSESRSTRWRTTVEGGLPDTENASAWFQPNRSLSELTFEYQSLQDDATPSFHIILAACATNWVLPTPTPASVGDSDGDGIPDAEEGTGDSDNDFNPNYTDQDSDGDTIPDAVEGNDDQDGDDIPDYLDKDSDGDDVPDEIERDPTREGDSSLDSDIDRNGIDDGDEGNSVEPLTDTDNDGSPDTEDQDSDNDSKEDGDEAYDLDGDGDRDIEPSGEDSDDNGIDDSYESFDDPTEINRDFAGIDDDPPCTTRSIAAQKAAVRKRLHALASRVGRFSARETLCGGSASAGLTAAAAVTRRTFERRLSEAYKDVELRCPKSVCPTARRTGSKARLVSLATQLGDQASRAKRAAIAACGEGPKNPNEQPRPGTPTYIAQLKKEIGKLPNAVTECR